MLGVHPITVAKWESGSHEPQGPTLLKLQELLGGAPDPPAQRATIEAYSIRLRDAQDALLNANGMGTTLLASVAVAVHTLDAKWARASLGVSAQSHILLVEVEQSIQDARLGDWLVVDPSERSWRDGLWVVAMGLTVVLRKVMMMGDHLQVGSQSMDFDQLTPIGLVTRVIQGL